MQVYFDEAGRETRRNRRAPSLLSHLSSPPPSHLRDFNSHSIDKIICVCYNNIRRDEFYSLSFLLIAHFTHKNSAPFQEDERVRCFLRTTINLCKKDCCRENRESTDDKKCGDPTSAFHNSMNKINLYIHRIS